MQPRRSILFELTRLAAVVAVPLLGVIAYLLIDSARHDLEHASDEARRLADHTAARTERFLGDFRATLEAVAQRPQVRAMDPARCDPALPTLRELYPKAGNIIVADAEGWILCGARPPAGGERIRIIDLDLHRAVLGTRRFGLSRPLIGRISKTWAVTAVQPVLDPTGRAIGAVGMAIDLRALDPFGVGGHADTTVGIVAAPGIVIAHSEDPPQWIGKGTREIPALANLLDGARESWRGVAFDSRERLWALRAVPGTDWTVYAGVAAENAVGPIRKRAIAALLLVLAIIGVTVLAAGHSARRIVRPVRAIANVANARAAGDIAARAPVEGPREVADVADAFNAMIEVRAQLHAALQQAYDELRQSQDAVMQQERLRALGQMASGVAHDINNAIAPIALYTESLLERETGLSERAREYLRVIRRAIEDVSETVARMRQFSRPRERQVELVRIDLNTIVQQVVELTRVRWRDLPQERGTVIEMRTDLRQRIPPILGAESDIRDSLTNLVFNAVDAMPSGGALTVRTQLGSNPRLEGEVVYLEVSDTGVGMDEETRQRCLEPFFTTKGERGTGLGLAMVYGMVQRHGADLEIDSAPGHGTTVRICFAAAKPAAPAEPARQADLALRPLSILLIDDDPLVLESVRAALDADGHRVVAADSGRAGIDAFSAALLDGNAFDVVITDLGMPHMDGRQVAAEVKVLSRSTPVMLLTGWGQRLADQGETPANVDCVLGKPPRLRELRLALAALMH